jgi:hypothetical protein
VLAKKCQQLAHLVDFGVEQLQTICKRHLYNDIIVLFPIRNTLEFTKEFCKYLNLNVAMFVGFCQSGSNLHMMRIFKMSLKVSGSHYNSIYNNT